MTLGTATWREKKEREHEGQGETETEYGGKDFKKGKNPDRE